MPQQLSFVSDLSAPDDEIERILDRLDADGGDVPNDHRAVPRHPLRGRAVCVILVHQDATEAMRVRLRNLSGSGVAFLSAMQLLPGTRIQLLIPPNVAPGIGDRVAIVRHIRVAEPNVFEIGAKFLG